MLNNFDLTCKVKFNSNLQLIKDYSFLCLVLSTYLVLFKTFLFLSTSQKTMLNVTNMQCLLLTFECVLFFTHAYTTR